MNLESGDFRLALLNGSGSIGAANSVLTISVWSDLSADEITASAGDRDWETLNT